MRGEIVRRSRRTVRFQVCRACTDNATNLSKSHRDEAAIGKRSNPKGDIDVLFQKIDGSILQTELNVNFRKRRQERRHNRQQMHAAEGERGRYNKVSARGRVLTGGGTLGFGHVVENSF